MLRFTPARQVFLGVCAAALTVLAGCSAISGDDGRNNPTELKSFEPALTVQAAWRAPVGSGTGVGFAPIVGRDTAYARAFNLLTKHAVRATLADEPEELGPEIARVVLAFLLAGAARCDPR